MPHLPKARLHKAFNEGRRAATEATTNPYANPKLAKLWEEGRAKQRAGETHVADSAPGAGRGAGPACRR